jgi:microcystin-dependent protein
MTDQYLGEVRVVAFEFAPQGWALCSGQVLQIRDNEALFSLLGTQYGGDGFSTYALPDLQGRVPVSFGQALSGSVYSMGDKGGEETHTLTTNEYPAHVHPLAGDGSTPASSNFAQPFGANLGQVAAAQTPGPAIPFSFYSDGAANTQLDSRGLANNSGGQSHANLQPYLVMNFIIATTGIFPARS